MPIPSGLTLTWCHRHRQQRQSTNCVWYLRHTDCLTRLYLTTVQHLHRKNFRRSNGVQHLRSAPYHPASKLSGSLETCLSRFLFKYRVTPQASTGIALSELLMGRRLRTHLDLLHPTVQDRVRRTQQSQKDRSDQHAKIRQFKIGDRVMCRNFRKGPAWVPGTVTESKGTSIFVKTDNGQIWQRHVDHVVASQVESEPDQHHSPESTVPPGQA